MPSPSPAAPRADAPDAARDALRRECLTILEHLVDGSPGLQYAVVASVDGREFAHAVPVARPVDAPRIAAIASSLLALSESFSRESLASRALYGSIATEHGSIATVRIPSRAQMHALCLCTDSSENLAMTIRAALDTAAALAAALDAAAGA